MDVSRRRTLKNGTHTNIALHVDLLWEVECERHDAKSYVNVLRTNDIILRLEQSKYFPGLFVWRALALFLPLCVARKLSCREARKGSNRTYLFNLLQINHMFMYHFGYKRHAHSFLLRSFSELSLRPQTETIPLESTCLCRAL